MRKRLLVLGLTIIFLASSLTMTNDAGTNINGKVIASITYRSNECSTSTLQPIVVITQPDDGAVVTDPHLIVLGYASDETGMNYWEWTWEWETGSYSNSSYFETAQYVEFRIDIYGLYPGWNEVTVCFRNIYGVIGCDAVNVTYNPPDNHPPTVTIDEPAEGQVFTEPNITVTGLAEDNAGVTLFGFTHEWEGGGTGSSWPLEEPTTYYPFEIPITLHDGWNKIKVYASDEAGNYGEDEVRVTLEYCSIDLTIYDGLEGAGGGGVVPESEEETRGAFTVTNIQDTNGDGIIDKDQNPVRATPKGRDEVDLMKMVLNQPLGLECGPNSLVYLVKSGSNSGQVKLWDSKTKDNEIPPTNPPDTWVYKVSELPKTVWAEIREENPLNLVMRGITFTYSTSCCNKTDVVKATGIWSEVTEVKHDSSDAWNNAVWPDMPKNVRDYIDEKGGFGLRRYQNVAGDWWYGNVIGIQFTVYPPGIGNEREVYFDITRQIHYKDRYVDIRLHRDIEQENWPSQVEQPNDDTHNDDESDKPSAQNHMYVEDAPGFGESNSRWGNILFVDSSNNFMEFMRVRLDGTKPLGETVQGSRCSSYYLWHAALWLNRDWKNPGQVTRRQNREIHPINCVEPGHILILDFSPPWS